MFALVSDQSEHTAVVADAENSLSADGLDALSHFTSGTLAKLCECFGFGICEKRIITERISMIQAFHNQNSDSCFASLGKQTERASRSILGNSNISQPSN